jgi:hypothetical protein
MKETTMEMKKPSQRMWPVRADLADPDYKMVREAAARERRSIASYIRNAVVDRIAADLDRISADDESR